MKNPAKRNIIIPPASKCKKRRIAIIAAGVALVLLITALILVLTMCNSSYDLSKDDMRKYFSLSREDYTNTVFDVDEKYEITDEDVTAYIEDILWANCRLHSDIVMLPGSLIGAYIYMTEKDGTPLSNDAAPSDFKVFPMKNDKGEITYYTSGNYHEETPVYITLGEGDGLPLAVREYLLAGHKPNESRRQVSGGNVLKDDLITVTYRAYYHDQENNKTVTVSSEVGLRIDLSQPNLTTLAQNTIGKTVDKGYQFQTKEVVGGIERDVTYSYFIENIIDFEETFSIPVTLSDTAYPQNSKYAGLNGKEVVYHIFVEGVYEVPELDEAFIFNTLEYETEAEDVVSDYKQHVKNSMMQEMKLNYVYEILWQTATDRFTPPDSYPDAMNRETEKFVNSILTHEEFNNYYAEAGYKSAEEYIRSYYLLNEEPYKSQPLSEALFSVVTDRREKEMLYVYFVQVENISFTDKEYEDYLLRRSKELQNKYNDSRYTPEYIEVLYDNEFGTGVFGTGYLRECLMYEKIAEFLYLNNQINYVKEQ